MDFCCLQHPCYWSSKPRPWQSKPAGLGHWPSVRQFQKAINNEKQKREIYSLWPQWEEELRASVTASPAGVLAWHFGLNRRQEEWWLNSPSSGMVLTKLPYCLGTWLLICPADGQHFVKFHSERGSSPGRHQTLNLSLSKYETPKETPSPWENFQLLSLQSDGWRKTRASLWIPLLLQGWRHLHCHPAICCSDVLMAWMCSSQPPELPLASIQFVIHRLCLMFPPELLTFTSTKKVRPRSLIAANL